MASLASTRPALRGALVGTATAVVAFAGVSIALASQAGLEESQEAPAPVTPAGLVEAQATVDSEVDQSAPETRTPTAPAGLMEAQAPAQPSAGPASSAAPSGETGQLASAAVEAAPAPAAPVAAAPQAAAQPYQEPVAAAPAYQAPAAAPAYVPPAPAYEPPAPAPAPAPASAPVGPEINLGRAPVVMPPVIQPKNITFG